MQYDDKKEPYGAWERLERYAGGSVGISYFALLDARNSDVKKKALSIRLSQKIFEE